MAAHHYIWVALTKIGSERFHSVPTVTLSGFRALADSVACFYTLLPNILHVWPFYTSGMRPGLVKAVWARLIVNKEECLEVTEAWCQTLASHDFIVCSQLLQMNQKQLCH